MVDNKAKNHLKPEVEENDPSSGFSRRMSSIAENRTVKQRGTENDYVNRRNQALNNNGDHTEQDAAILSAMHEEEYEDWSSGTSIRRATVAKKVKIAMSSAIGKSSPPPPPHTQIKDQNDNEIIHEEKEDKVKKRSIASTVSYGSGGSAVSGGSGSNSNPDQDLNKMSIDSRLSSKSYVSKMDEDMYSEIEFDKFKPSICKHLLAFILLTLLCGAAFYYYYVNEWKTDKIYYRMSYAAVMWVIGCLLLFLNLCDSYHGFHEVFASLCGHRGAAIFLILFFLFGLTEYIMISLDAEEILISEKSLGGDQYDISLVLIDIFWYLSIFLLFATSMAWWPTISYFCSESSYFQAFLYMTFIGYILIFICRQLRPPSNSKSDIISWYRRRDSLELKAEIINVTCFLFFVLILLFAIVVPLFGEAVRVVSAFGSWYAIGAYIIMSFLVMLTPLLPGSIIDVAGGFLFLYVLVVNEHFDFYISWVIALCIVIVLHYLGACAQWFIGKMRFVQFWLNTTFPPDLLAASDAVLDQDDTTCISAGIIGYVFLDTGNGLNQGRISMPFWTQFCSEWGNIPNAIAVVSLGATIALPAIYPDAYIAATADTDSATATNTGTTLEPIAASTAYIFLLFDIMVPLLILIAGLVQCTGLTIGARSLGKAVDTDEFMMAREKWKAVKFFYDVLGVIPSKEGWKHDVLQLAQKNDQYPAEHQRCLYEDVMPLQRWYINANNSKKLQEQKKLNREHHDKERQFLSTSKLKMLVLDKYRNDISTIRDSHYSAIEQQYDTLILDKKWLIDPTNGNMYNSSSGLSSNRYFAKENIQKIKYRSILQLIILILMVISFWISSYRIWWQTDLYNRIAFGIAIFGQTTSWYDWIAVAIFCAAFIIYFHAQIISSAKNTGKTVWFMLKCCKINKNIESRFPTPFFDNAKYTDEYFENLDENLNKIQPDINIDDDQDIMNGDRNIALSIGGPPRERKPTAVNRYDAAIEVGFVQ